MMQKYIFPSICFLITLFSTFSNASNDRKNKDNHHSDRWFSTEVNPGCSYIGSDCSTWTNISLIHIQSIGVNDSLHFIWSFVGSPSVLMVRTPLDSILQINWDEFFSGNELAISFDGPKPLYEFGWSLTKVWVFEDEDDEVKLPLVNQTGVQGFDTKNFKWDRMDSGSVLNSSHVKIPFESWHYYDEDMEETRSLGDHGYFKITVRMHSQKDYSESVPYMLYTENNTQVDIGFHEVELNTSKTTFPKHPRVGFNFIFVQNDSLYLRPNDSMRVEKIKTLDDEHTPGVFEVYNLRTPRVNDDHDESYLQWKPICYTAEVRVVEDSVDAWNYPLERLKPSKYRESLKSSLLLWSYFGENRISSQLVESLNITFGTQQDGFYTKTKHISWTFSTGFGEPPQDYVSVLVILVVTVGLGIPALIILGSFFYVVLKRLRAPRDDLLLGR